MADSLSSPLDEYFKASLAGKVQVMPQPILQNNETREPSNILLECRNVYGQGMVKTIAHIDQGVILIEQRTTTKSFFIPLLSPQARERLKDILALSIQR